MNREELEILDKTLEILDIRLVQDIVSGTPWINLQVPEQGAAIQNLTLS